MGALVGTGVRAAAGPHGPRARRPPGRRRPRPLPVSRRYCAAVDQADSIALSLNSRSSTSSQERPGARGPLRNSSSKAISRS